MSIILDTSILIELQRGDQTVKYQTKSLIAPSIAIIKPI